MTYPTCKTCRHWQHDFDDKRLTVQGLCLAAKFSRLNADYDSDDHPTPTMILANGKPLDSDAIGALDGSGYWAAVVTGPDFGCIKHEAKE